MKKAILLFSIAFTCFLPALIAQPPCGFDFLHKKLLKENPAVERTMQVNEASIQRYITQHPEIKAGTAYRLSAPLYTIPVVVHVVHTGGAIGSVYNPTDAQIIAAVNYLNQVYDGTFPGTQGVGEIQIQFALAQRDPNCNPTNGIDRINGSSVPGYTSLGVNANNTNGVDEVDVKDLSRWNTSDYYNIWVVNKIDGADGTSGSFIAGFAYFPGAPPSLDGTIMLATQMIPGQKTLPHEIGHALSLHHPFYPSVNSADCPANSNCNTQGDLVCDTDPVTYNETAGVFSFACRTGGNVCGGTYSINTESNYMGYTNCFTLFTAGQKARMLAAMGLPQRASLATSLGATPTYSGATQCLPKINFDVSDDNVTETTVTTSGCRLFRDYTYNLTIGNNPSVATTATLAISSATATEGVDFDITTNGNFASPSKVVSFPTGSHNSQPFTIRIYNDAIVDGTETFTLDFTVNNGGGNAVIGNSIPTLSITINDNDVSPIVPGTYSNYTVGVFNGGLGSTTAFRSNEVKHRLQVLFTAAELTAAGIAPGNIAALTLRVVTKNSTKPFNGFTISMAHTANTNLSTGFVPVAFTQVYQSNYSSVVGDNLFNFGTGGGSAATFTWNGTSNLVIQFCFDNAPGSADPANDIMEGNLSPLGAGVRASTFSNHGVEATAGCALAAVSVSDLRLSATFSAQNPGNPVATTAVTSNTEYLGPNADVYFYNNTGQIMARITNLTSFDYGCTQVSIDRTGTTSAQFWNSNVTNYLASKTFRVIPTNNTAGGHYQIHLYYSQAEINGWQTASAQVIANAKTVKVSNGNFVPDVTLASPHIGDVSFVNAANAAYGTSYIMSGDFSSTGFSGFGIGIPGAASTLPVTWLSFDGNKQAKSVVLEWKTASEFNSDHFEIETSKDGNSYYKIGSINSSGNSSAEQTYHFTDELPVKGINYYRLAQVDINEHKTYSKTISVTFEEIGNRVVIYPNPVNDKLFIDLAQPARNVILQIHSLDGKLIRQMLRGYMMRNEMIYTGDLNSGTYLLRINTGTDIYNLKFVKP